MCWSTKPPSLTAHVSVAGCLGYDVLERLFRLLLVMRLVSVAGCLGYDVLVDITCNKIGYIQFQLLVV